MLNIAPVVHKKSSAASFGADRLCELAMSIDKKAKAGELTAELGVIPLANVTLFQAHAAGLTEIDTPGQFTNNQYIQRFHLFDNSDERYG